jgi:hypothetical protein
MLGVAGCSSGKSWNMASLWPWSKSNSSASQTKVAQNTPGRPELPTAKAKPSTVGTQTQLAAGTSAPSWNTVALAGGAGAAGATAATGATPPNWQPSPYGAPGASPYGAAAADPYAAHGASPYGAPLGAAPSYGQPAGYGAPAYTAQNYNSVPGYGSPGVASGAPGYSHGTGTHTGVTPGFDTSGAAWQQTQPQTQVNPYAHPGTGAGAGYGSSPGLGVSGASYGSGGLPAGQVAASPFPGAAGAAQDPSAWANSTASGGAVQPYPSTGDAASGFPASTSAVPNYASASGAPAGGGFAPGSTRQSDPAAAGAGLPTATNNQSLSAPPAQLWMR